MIQISDASTLSWSTRIKLFAVCFLLGVILSVLVGVKLPVLFFNLLKVFVLSSLPPPPFFFNKYFLFD